MGIFGNEVIKSYRELLKIVKEFDLDLSEKEFLINYIEEVKNNKRNNDFCDFDTLRHFILTCLNEQKGNIVNYFNKITSEFKHLLPLGINTPDYDVIKKLIITSGMHVDKNLFALFDNPIDAFNVARVIEDVSVYSDEIFKYASLVSPYCASKEVLKFEILSYIEGLKNEVGDIDSYTNNKLEEAKKRCGIYPVDEKQLALIAAQVRQTKGLIRKLENLQKKVDDYKEVINGLILSGRKELDEHAKNKVFEMKENIELVKNEMITKLDEYLLVLEENLKKDSDIVFNKILEDAKSQLREIKIVAQNLGNTTASDLLRIQKASEESLEKLKKYVETEPNLREVLKSAGESQVVKEALLKLGEVKETKVVQASEGIVLPGHERLIVPASPSVVLPHEYTNSSLISAFDESIPFDIRYKKIMDEKNRREANGEIFHHLVDEVINCVMEGDWVYLWGPSGCGKSHIIKQVASLVGIDLIENGKITDKYSIMAYNDPHGRFRATQAFVALVYGKLLSFDEFDNGNTDTQVVLNELYSGLLDVLENPLKNRFVTFAEDMTVKVNPNFRMISAGNTSGEGENPLYSSRGKIDESVQERMTPKRFDYDNRVEKRIFGSYEAWYNIFVNFRKACDDFAKREDLSSAPGMITTRDASAIVKYIRHNSKSVDQIMSEKFVQIKDLEYLRFIADAFKKMYGVEECVDFQINTSLDAVSEKDLAKKLIYGCTYRGKK